MQINIIDCDTSLENVNAVAKQYGTGIEIQRFANYKNLDAPEAMLEEIEQLLPKERRSMHGPFFGLIPSAYDPLVRDVAMYRHRQAYAIGKQMEVGHMVFHTGYSFVFAPGQDIYDRFKAFWHTLLEGKEDGIEIHIENVFETKWEYLRDFIAAVGKPNVSACLDIGHVNANSPHTHAEWIKGLGSTIRYVHLHNNFGEKDDHNGLDKGTIPMRETLDLLLTYSPNAIWTIETDEVNESFDWLAENGYL